MVEADAIPAPSPDTFNPDLIRSIIPSFSLGRDNVNFLKPHEVRQGAPTGQKSVSTLTNRKVANVIKSWITPTFYIPTFLRCVKLPQNINSDLPFTGPGAQGV